MLMRCAVFVLLFAAQADDKKPPTADELKAKIAALKTELAALETELAKLEPAKEIRFEKGGRGALPMAKQGYYHVLRVAERDVLHAVLVQPTQTTGGVIMTRVGYPPIVVRGVADHRLCR